MSRQDGSSAPAHAARSTRVAAPGRAPGNAPGMTFVGGVAGLIGMSLIGAGLISASPAMASGNTARTPQITISGQGSVAVEPDMAILDLGVTQEAETAREALNANNRAMAEVIAAMKEAGIAPKDLQTSNFSIYPVYTHHNPREGEEQKPPTITGYVVSNNLTVRIRDLSNLGRILDESVTLGVNTGGGLRFANDDPKAEIAKARSAAMRDAVERANTLLEAAGASMGRILSIDETADAPRPVPLANARMMAAEASDSVPVEAGENTYKVNVTVTWEIIQ